MMRNFGQLAERCFGVKLRLLPRNRFVREHAFGSSHHAPLTPVAEHLPFKASLAGPICPGVKYSKDYWAILALFRFVLALAVVGHHLTIFGLPCALPELFRPIGKTCVLAFLLISGVSVGHSFSERPEGFYTRRFLRIYPLYFAAIAFSLVVMVLVPAPVHAPHHTFEGTTWFAVVGNLLFLQGLAVTWLPYDVPLWSLSLEIWLYALAPFLARLPRAVLPALAILSLAQFALTGGAVHVYYVRDFLALSWPWLIGFLLARQPRKALGVWLGAAGSLVLFRHEFLTLSGKALCVAMYVSVLAAVLFAGRVRLSGWACRVGNFLGDVSYPVYLFHCPLIILLYVRFGVRSDLGFVAPVLVASAALAVWYDGWAKWAFWRPLTMALVRRLPACWTLFRADAGRRVVPPAVSAAPALVPGTRP